MLMPEFLLDSNIWIQIWPVPVFSGAIALLALVFFRRQIGDRKAFFAIVFAFALIGLVTGKIGGNSREPALDAIMPAILALISGLSLFLIGTKGRGVQLLVAACSSVLFFNLLVGAYWGSSIRENHDAYFKSANYQFERELDQAALQELRKKHGLPTPKPKPGKDLNIWLQQCGAEPSCSIEQ